ncbi:hypothetical protein A0H81_02673 [Grifola frondosa]|uniref:Uncharacterized protein n=1 Tax=Grifola frondosa TaxID=5627 RepID=A0A1C7MN19_GRIFR|nr:hypothetical protein A0H81_02673 [Grifola frondosa]
MSSTLDSNPPVEFPSPFDRSNCFPITLVELRMRTFSGQIREKPRWWEKVHNPEIMAKWRKEIVEQDEAVVNRFWGGEERFNEGRGEKKWPRDNITDAQLDYIFDELRYLACQADLETGIQRTSIDRIYQSMTLIPANLKAALLDGASALESVPQEQQDWHPGSNNQVLDLVHPSLYCLRIGKSPMIKSPPEGTDLLVFPTVEEYNKSRPDLKDAWELVVSQQHQWLPADFEVSAAGEVRPLGYINNLHLITHKPLYSTIAMILQCFVPLFERVLSDSAAMNRPLAIHPEPMSWYEKETPEWDEDDESTRERWEREFLWPVIHDPAPFVPPNPDKQALGTSKEWRRNIVATGLYYYASENITESKLGFRAGVGEYENGPYWDYQPDDSKGWTVAFGFGNTDPKNQEVGSIVAKEDKCLAFSNIYQHRVAPFELEDPTKPGHRKILCFFLVNPFVPVASTSNVPPQQRSWYTDELDKVPQFLQLPQELLDIILNDALAGTITLDEAKKEREKLMEERANFVVEHNQQIFEMEFSMCEH